MITKQEAVELAAARDDWYVAWPGPVVMGPYSEDNARKALSGRLPHGEDNRCKLLRVVEDYDR